MLLSLWLWYDGGCFSGLWSYLPLVFSEKVKRGLASTMLLMLVCIFFDITQGSQDNRDVDDDFF